MTDGTTPPDIELYLRSLAPDGTRPAVDDIVERLQRLDAAGAIADLTVHVTGEKVCPESPTTQTGPGQRLLDRVAAFEAWADRTDRSISEPFRRVEDARGIDGSDHSGVTFPTMAMAEYEDDDLRFVSPTTEGSVVYTVRDRLDVLVDRTAEPVSDRTGEAVD